MTLSGIGWAQTIFNYGPEFGVSFSQFPQKETYVVKSRGDQVAETTVPVISPLVGFTGQLNVKKHLQFTFHLQYQKVGKRYHYHRDGYDYLYKNKYTSDQWENQMFQKLCLPITMGYTFNIKGQPLSVFLGARPNLIFQGQYYYKSVADYVDDSSAPANSGHQDFTRETEFNPFNPNEAAMPAKRFRNQLLVGASTLIRHNFKLSLTYNLGMSINYAQFKPQGFESFSGKSMLNSDLGISVAYLLKP